MPCAVQVMDYGYPQFTEAQILQEFIKTDSYRMEVRSSSCVQRARGSSCEQQKLLLEACQHRRRTHMCQGQQGPCCMQLHCATSSRGPWAALLHNQAASSGYRAAAGAVQG